MSASPGGRVVALVEHEVEHAQHGVEPVGQPVAGRDLVADPGLADLLLRPHEPLGERGLRDEERAGDLGRGQAAERAQRQRDRRLRRERRVAAGEDQSQLVVGDRMHLVLRRHEHRVGRAVRVVRRVARDRPGLVREPARPSDTVDRAVAGRRRDPGARVVGDPVGGPALQRHEVRVGDGLLGEVEVAEDRMSVASARPWSSRNALRDRVAGAAVGVARTGVTSIPRLPDGPDLDLADGRLRASGPPPRSPRRGRQPR